MAMKGKWALIVSLSTVVSMLTACTPGGGASTSAPGGNAASDHQKVELRMTWWGSQVRHDATLKVIELFEKKHPNVKISGEFLGSDGYWDKLNTQIAGGNPPDLIQLGNNYPDYVARNAILDLNPYVNKEINVTDFEKSTVDSGVLDGKLYGIVLGTNAFGIAYNTELIKKSGLQPPSGNWTWDEFGKYAQDLSKTLGKGYYGAVDESRLSLYLNYKARQTNKTLFKDGKIGLGQAEISDWLTTWDNYRKSGSVPPAEFTTAYTEQPDNSSFVEGKTAMHLIWSNQINAFQKAMKDEINIVLPPNGGQSASQGLWLQPSQFMSVSAKTKHPKEAAMFINFMVNDPEAAMVLGSERGVPGSSKIRDALKEKASPVDKKMYDYIDLAAKNSRILDRELPNIKEFDSTILNVSQKVAFGKQNVPDAAKELTEAIEKAINKK